MGVEGEGSREKEIEVEMNRGSGIFQFSWKIPSYILFGPAEKLTDEPDDKRNDNNNDEYTCPNTGFKNTLYHRATCH